MSHLATSVVFQSIFFHSGYSHKWWWGTTKNIFNAS